MTQSSASSVADARSLPHAFADDFAAAEFAFIAVNGEVLFDFQNQRRVARAGPGRRWSGRTCRRSGCVSFCAYKHCSRRRVEADGAGPTEFASARRRLRSSGRKSGWWATSTLFLERGCVANQPQRCGCRFAHSRAPAKSPTTHSICLHSLQRSFPSGSGNFATREVIAAANDFSSANFTSFTVLVSPGSKRTAVPAGISRRLP